MAGMFYSIKEVCDKLQTSEDEVRKLVRGGRLREFRDGPNLLFKVDEVESLMSDTGVMGGKAQKGKAPEEAALPEEEISLASDQPASGAEAIELSDADTAIVEEGIKILGETDAKDALDETSGVGGGEALAGLEETSAAAADEASLKEIEGDVSLDTFGSGSGLLDLSLQADDTSLGGILDEIYATGEEGKGGKPAGAAPAEASGAAAEAAAPAEGAEPMLAEEVFAEPQAAPVMPMATAVAHVEAPPDKVSNALGLMLWIPLLVTIYTGIVVVAGFSNLMPTALKQVQGIIWYVLIGLAVLSILIAGGAAVTSGEKKPKAPKVMKEKPKKEKKDKKKGKEAPPAEDNA